MIFSSKKEISQRDLIIQYKRIFGTPEGKAVLFDIMNRNFYMNSTRNDREAGRRDAMLEIATKVYENLSDFDKLMKGESDE